MGLLYNNEIHTKEKYFGGGLVWYRLFENAKEKKTIRTGRV